MYSSRLFFPSLHFDSLFLFHTLFFSFRLSFARSLTHSLCAVSVCMWLYVDFCRSPFFDHTHSLCVFNLRSVFTSFTVYMKCTSHTYSICDVMFRPVCERMCARVECVFVWHSNLLRSFDMCLALTLVVVHIRPSFIRSFERWCSTYDQYRNIWVLHTYAWWLHQDLFGQYYYNCIVFHGMHTAVHNRYNSSWSLDVKINLLTFIIVSDTFSIFG